MVSCAERLLLTGLLLLCCRTAFALKEGDSCFFGDDVMAVCTRARSCSSLPALIKRGQRPPICNFVRNVPIVCCAMGDVRAQQPEHHGRWQKTWWRYRWPMKRVTTTHAPVTTTHAPLTTTTSGKMGMMQLVKSRKSWEMCQEYSKTVHVKYQSPQLLFEPEDITETDCYSGQQLISGGTKAMEKEFPHMAALGFWDGLKKDYEWRCGGTLISDRFVMTAAHCLQAHATRGAKKVKVSRVRLGVLNPWAPGDHLDAQTLRVVDTFTTPEYSRKEHYHDIALLKLDHAVTFSSAVRPACLDAGALTKPGALATATGWGRTEKGEISKDLLKVDLTYQPVEKCNSTFDFVINYANSTLPRGIVDNSMICAGDEKGTGDTCMGDSGGPLQVRLQEPVCMYSVVGVTSFGNEPCGNGHAPAVYTRVAAYMDWIESVVWPT